MSTSEYEGFSSYDAFADSIGAGFTNQINDRLAPDAELWPNMDGYSVLCEVFGSPLARERIEMMNTEDVTSIQAALNEDDALDVSEQDVVDLIRGALWQSFGEANLANF